MDKRIFLIFIPILTNTLIMYSFFQFSPSSNPVYFFNFNSFPEESNILSGYYTGTIIIRGVATVPEGFSATILNASIVCDDIYVYGSFSISNSCLYSNIYLMGSANADFYNVTFMDEVQVYYYDLSQVYIENIKTDYNYTTYYPTPEVLTFGKTELTLNDTVITLYAYEQSNLTIINMKNYSSTGQRSTINLLQDANASIKNSQVDYLYLGDHLLSSLNHKCAAILNSSSITTMKSYGNSTAWLLNSSYTQTIWGFHNATFYVDGSSSYSTSFLYDNSVIIPI
ncbi:MAG: hypothetical protein ACTSRG_26060 [Candidatus Helarchaeota archaeon]